ncbi:WASH complex subunit 2 [Amyelois transitella]|uniref:WASH complex subunit 2 n=1 Tax=Amyelois transitella TaxID=680683 RepID=UPI00298FCDBE|nr:WASH complex subunit 2 [Amyelois transitella]
MEADTDALRSAAPQWSLAGDKQLLGVLQNIHERLVSRCQETNRRLGEMAAALDGASIDLQNVNNKFTALSNRQFIESRVYDDDTDLAAPADAKKEPTKSDVPSELEQIKFGLKVLEDMHEPLLIMDSDSESDSDGETSRTILKPKDLYEDRPLPYIIGSYAWQSKWHAGLQVEDSDSESSVKRWRRDEVSESDAETNKPDGDQVSNISSDMSDRQMNANAHQNQHVTSQNQHVTPENRHVTPENQHVTLNAEAKTQAHVANELARKLRGELPEPQSQTEEYEPPPMTKKFYRPEQPATSNIFPDEPPPLEHSYRSDDDDDDDIFAKLRKSQPYAHSNTVQSNITEELFGVRRGDKGVAPPAPANQKSTLFSDESEPELFEQPPPLPKEVKSLETNNPKKPVGGISLFGNKGTESIGAAILKRNQRQSSSEDEASEDTSPKKDIFDHLFAKSEKEQRKVEEKVEKEQREVEKETVKVGKKVDLFSDNLFDDIDDLFTSNIPKVPIKPAPKNQKSLFDDEDDLFLEVSVVKNNNNSVKDAKDNKKSIFDSDDELFQGKPEKIPQSNDDSNKNKSKEETKKENSIKSDGKKSIFDSDDDSLPDNAQKNKPKNLSVNDKNTNEIIKTKSIFDDSDNDIFSENSQSKSAKGPFNVNENKNVVKTDEKNKSFNDIKSKEDSPMPVLDAKCSLFDDDEDDLFKTVNIDNKAKEVTSKSVEKTQTDSNISTISRQQITKSLFYDELEKKSINNDSDKTVSSKKTLFDDDSEDDLFGEKHKRDVFKNENSKAVEKSPNIFEEDDLFNDTSMTKVVPVSSREHDLKSEIKDEILEVNKDEIKSEIVDEVITELKDDSEINKNKPDKLSEHIDETSQTNKIVKSTIYEDGDQLHMKFEPNVKSVKDVTIFEDSDDELFMNSGRKVEIVNENTNTLKTVKQLEKKEAEPGVTKSDIPQVKKNDKIVDETEENPSISKEKELQPENIDKFSDIFMEPPKFEKPKEPKKSKNINALFDDDSDDEALFFKKNDPTLDEKPEFEPPTNENRLFGLFQDEPPDLDIDFVPKTKPINEPNVSQILSSHGYNVNIPKSENGNMCNDQTDSNLPPKTEEVKQNDEDIKSLENTNKDLPKQETVDDSKDQDNIDNGVKPIGKLKTMNFNINVNALLPGAMPKKSKQTEHADRNAQTKSSEDIHVKDTPELESKMVKSISFEEKHNSQVLDNTLSKERARIQVKRRPSTRRARKEAVRKSGIDFGDDSTDNSSSIDDQPKETKKDQTKVDELIRSDPESKSTEKEEDYAKDDLKVTKLEDKDLTNDKNNVKTLNEELFKVEKEAESKIKANASLNENFQESDDLFLPKPEVTTKTVYILNDEDIFSEKPKKVLNIVDEDVRPGISTLGKVYKETEDSLKKSLSDSDDDLFRNVKPKSKTDKSNSKRTDNIIKSQKNELDDKNVESDTNFENPELQSKSSTNNTNDIFKSPKNVIDNTHNKLDDENTKNIFNKNETKVDLSKQKTTEKPNISLFDLSDDDEMFTKNDAGDVFKKSAMRVDVKAPLFCDDDDDDLFGSGSRNKAVDKSSSVPQSSRAKDITQSSEPVFEDPLSLLGRDDD